MRAYNFASGLDLATTAHGGEVNLQSSLVKPAIYIKGVTQAVTATSASPAVFTAADTAVPNGTPVILGGTAPTGFTAGVTYWAVASSGMTFELAATRGGSAINSSSTGTGVTADAMIDFGSGASGGYDEDGKQGFQFSPGNSVVVAIDSAADHAGTSVALQGADPDASDPTVAGSYSDLFRVSGISTATQLANVVLKQFIRWDIVADASEGADVASITLLCQ